MEKSVWLLLIVLLSNSFSVFAQLGCTWGGASSCCYSSTQTGTCTSGVVQKLFQPTGSINDYSGYGSDISGDGRTAVVGAPQLNVAGPGKALVFNADSSGNWNLAATLTASDGHTNQVFGTSVAISLDGSTIAVGAHNAAYIYTRSGTSWVEQKLTASDLIAQDDFGNSVDISGDGKTVVISAFHANGKGAVYIFTYSGGTWLQQKIIASDGATGDIFGNNVAISSDASTVIVGAIHAITGVKYGAAYVFVKSGSSWNFAAKLLASNSAGEFGWDVASSSDGSFLIVSALNTASNGQAFIFAKSGGVWNEQINIIANDAAVGDYFGWSVNMSPSGDVAIVGAPSATVSTNPGQGKIYIFVRSGNVWNMIQKLTTSPGDSLGFSTGISAEGSTVVAGAPGNSGTQGAAYIFGGCWTPQPCNGATACSAGSCITCGIDGTLCNDGNACTQLDTCQGGICIGSNPKICTASDQCHQVGVCDSATGQCSNPLKPDGTPCNDQNACTQTDICQAGTCTGSNPFCPGSQTCVAGTCIGWAFTNPLVNANCGMYSPCIISWQCSFLSYTVALYIVPAKQPTVGGMPNLVQGHSAVISATFPGGVVDQTVSSVSYLPHNIYPDSYVVMALFLSSSNPSYVGTYSLSSPFLISPLGA